MRAIGLVLLAGVVTQLGCGGTDEIISTPPQGPRNLVEIAPQVSGSWEGYKLGASPGKWYDLGELPVATEASEAWNPTVDELSEGPPATDDNMVIADFKARRLYEVEVSRADVEKVARHLEAKGYAEGTPGDAAEQHAADQVAAAPTVDATKPHLITKSFGSGIDDRSARGIFEYGVVAEPYQKIGHLLSQSGFCTGTLIGTPDTGYYVITSAHCIFDAQGNWLYPTFVPRHDDCHNESGAWVNFSCNTYPYGAWSTSRIAVQSYFQAHCRGISPLPLACVADDIALLEVTGSGGPGAMGFGAWNDTDLNNSVAYNRGYPACDAHGPFGCRDNTLFGDSHACSLGGYSSPDTDGWTRIVHHSCDTSPGMSGSALYLYSNGAKVFAVHQGYDSECWSSSCTNPRPNRARRITTAYYNTILWFMGL